MGSEPISAMRHTMTSCDSLIRMRVRCARRTARSVNFPPVDPRRRLNTMSDMMSQGSPNSVAHNSAVTLPLLKGLDEVARELGVGELEAKKAIEDFIAPGSTNSLGKVWEARSDKYRSDVLACVSDKRLVAVIAVVINLGSRPSMSSSAWIRVTVYGLKVDEAHQGKKLGERLLLTTCMMPSNIPGKGALSFSIPSSGECHRNVDACILYHNCGWTIEGAKCETDKIGAWTHPARGPHETATTRQHQADHQRSKYEG